MIRDEMTLPIAILAVGALLGAAVACAIIWCASALLLPDRPPARDSLPGPIRATCTRCYGPLIDERAGYGAVCELCARRASHCRMARR